MTPQQRADAEVRGYEDDMNDIVKSAAALMVLAVVVSLLVLMLSTYAIVTVLRWTGVV